MIELYHLNLHSSFADINIGEAKEQDSEDDSEALNQSHSVTGIMDEK